MSQQLVTAADVTSDAYMALRLVPGAMVDYRGSLAGDPETGSGPFTVQPCECRPCFARVLLGHRANRYDLYALDGRHAATHVRHTSVVPVPSERELDGAGVWIPTSKVALHLRRMLRAAFPGQKFSVRTGRRDRKGLAYAEITVVWEDGPSETAVATVAAPLLATYGTPDHCRPQWIAVRSEGRTYCGMPNLHAVHLDRR
ncbi:LPD29 domain-containing protein [Kitasatospora sp. NPDC088783]|uniref:LPD29 domain-containing protein n=1 Tax=Kitasatospora sp. NPDC088783 TaxID=3364077 RepID=UPI0037F5291A